MNKMQAVVDELKNECEVVWKGIQETHHRLGSHLGGKEPCVAVDNSDSRIKLLQHKERRLKAQLDVLRKQDLDVVSKDPEFLQTLHNRDLEKTVEQLEVNLTMIKGQRQELAGDIQRVTKEVEEQEEFQRKLEQKLSVYQDEDENEAHNKLVEDLQQIKKKAKEHNKNSMRRLGKFVSEHFPKPVNESEKGPNGKGPVTYCTLLHIIELMMNYQFESPHDPYVPLLPTYWPPYIELLLRYGIIQRHPNDSNLICLVGYQLT